jgi:glycine/D-amino acid oxidase-like deaminating enzyme
LWQNSKRKIRALHFPLRRQRLIIMRAYDAVVIGGGLVGAAIAYGLARRNARVALLDEGDVAFRASRGNFGLVWVQSKGVGVPEYQSWSRLSSDLWADFAAELTATTGIDCAHERRGGVHISLSEEELAHRKRVLEQIHLEAGHGDDGASRFEYEILDRAELARRIPAIGPQPVGGAYTRYDGAANPLYLLRALHAASIRHGAQYFPRSKVVSIRAAPHAFSVDAGGAAFRAPRLVLAAGLGNKDLAAHVGLNVPVRPVRGQIIVTERIAPVIPLTHSIRQMPEGGLLIGDSYEEAGFDDTTTPPVQQALAARAVRIFPFLRDVRVVRHWAALRVMSPDGLPIYEQSQQFPGAFVATCHSGVTLAAAHALKYAEGVERGSVPAALARFAGTRFDVPKAA